MDEYFGTLLGIIGVFGFSFVSAFNRHNKTFSLNIFLCGIVIGNGILIWVGVVPYYAIVVSSLAIAGMFFSNGENNE